MNLLQRALIEKIANDNGFEHVISSELSGVILASALHSTRASINQLGSDYLIKFIFSAINFQSELDRSFTENKKSTEIYKVESEAQLASLLQRAASLSRALPSRAADEYQYAVGKELEKLPAGIYGTEIERLVRQRVGQNKFREAMLDYWGSACAVTGVGIKEVLRASHAKPWAECQSDAERMDVFNGFLLSANLDALFDRFLISFEDDGRIIISASLQREQIRSLGVSHDMVLRWIDKSHHSYLAYHRSKMSFNDFIN